MGLEFWTLSFRESSSKVWIEFFSQAGHNVKAFSERINLQRTQESCSLELSKVSSTGSSLKKFNEPIEILFGFSRMFILARDAEKFSLHLLASPRKYQTDLKDEKIFIFLLDRFMSLLSLISRFVFWLVHDGSFGKFFIFNSCFFIRGCFGQEKNWNHKSKDTFRFLPQVFCAFHAYSSWHLKKLRLISLCCCSTWQREKLKPS